MDEDLSPPRTPAVDLPPPADADAVPDPVPADLAAALDQVVARLSALPPVPMPPEVWARLEQVIGQQAGTAPTVEEGAGAASGAPANVVPLRPRRRWIPATIAAAAAVVAAGLVIPGIGRDVMPVAEGPGAASVTTPRTGETAARVATIDAMSAHHVVASGTDYRADSLPEQVVAVLRSVGVQDPSTVVAKVSTPELPPAPTLLGTSGITADLQALHDCLAALAGGGHMPAALLVDRARYAGEDAAVIVLAEQMQLSPPRAELHVIVIRPGCTEVDRAQAEHVTFSLAS